MALAGVLDDHEVVDRHFPGVGVDLDPRELRGEGRGLHGEGRMAHAEHRRYLGHVEVALLADLGERDRPIRHAADHHAPVLDLEVVDGRFHLGGGDLERLAPGVLRRLEHRGAHRVDGLAPRAEPGHGRRVGVAGGDAHLVDVDAVGRRGDLGQGDVRAGDVHLAGEHAERAVGVEPDRGARRLEPGDPAAHREARAAPAMAVLVAALRPLRPVLPERMLGEPRQHLLGPVALPGLAVRHRIAFLHEVAEAELDRVEPELRRAICSMCESTAKKVWGAVGAR